MDASSSLIRTATSGLIAMATAIVILAASILPFLTPAWVGFEQGRSQVTTLTGFSEPEVRTITNAILGDLVLGGGDFLVAGGPKPNLVLTDAERSHMRDVRGGFGGFGLLALVSLAILVVAAARARGQDHATRAAAWVAVLRGAGGLAVGIVVAGLIALVAFDAAFEVFHRLFFAPGSFEFDPRTSRLVQLFPDQFWSETTIALAAVILVASLAVVRFAGRRVAPRAQAQVVSALAVGEASR